jgi:serine/threonine protein kinase
MPQSKFSYLCLSFLLHYLIIPIASDHSAPPYTPTENITLSCGFSGNSIPSLDGRIWIGDIQQLQNNPSVTSATAQPPPSITVPYFTARLSRSVFTYLFPQVTAGKKFIRLYFYPATYQNFERSKALFSVKLGSYTLLHEFNASVTSDADANLSDTIQREFCISIEDDQGLNITFVPSPTDLEAYAFINGIEIVSMPPYLYYTPAEEENPGFEFIGQPNNLARIENNSALEMLYRINVGGADISPAKDTGMFRMWLADDDYLTVPGSSVLPVNLTIHLLFNRIAPYTAPEEVFRTARTMGKDKATNKNYNLTWEFPVDYGFEYLVRLHFCEFQPEISKAGDRVFLIYIDNQIAEKRFDVISSAGGKGVPIYMDYAVWMPSAQGKEKKLNLSVALQANPADWQTAYNDAILNGIEIFKLSDFNRNLAGPNPDPLPMTPTTTAPPSQLFKKQTRVRALKILGGVVSGVVVLSIIGFLVFRRAKRVERGGSSDRTTWWHPFSFSKTKSTQASGSGTSLPSDLCRYFSLTEIRAATNNFDDVFIVGVGGFGNVYKGCMDDGATLVAIKRLNPGSQQGAHEFKTEIEMLSQLRHLNLVSLIGYCNDGGEMILVYDYMAQGTFRDHLYNTDNPPLSWEQRLEICIGAARGLHYLHRGAKQTIIHRDVKTTNILLDEKWVAKVSDFGLSRIGPTGVSMSHVSTVVKGSIGYLDPEYYRRQRLTEKSDVYSFGVVLCEVLCGRPPLIRNADKEQLSLAEWTRQRYRRGKLDEIVDPFLKGKIAPECLEKFGEIAVNCMLDDGMERPSMNDVVWGLEFALQLQESKNHKKPATSDHCDEGLTSSSGRAESNGKSGRVNRSMVSDSFTYGTTFSESLWILKDDKEDAWSLATNLSTI